VIFVEETFVEETLAPTILPDDSRAVEDTEPRVVCPTTVRYPPTLMFVEETFVDETVTMPSLPRDVIVPVADTENWVVELTWRLMKSPLKPEAMFDPMYVPVTLESWIGFGPNWKSSELVDESGLPESRRASPESDDWMYPVARMFVEDTGPSVDWPLTTSEPPWIYPPAVMFVEETFVPEALVKMSVGKSP